VERNEQDGARKKSYAAHLTGNGSADYPIPEKGPTPL
jgi:hypothetical protein